MSKKKQREAEAEEEGELNLELQDLDFDGKELPCNKNLPIYGGPVICHDKTHARFDCSGQANYNLDMPTACGGGTPPIMDNDEFNQYMVAKFNDGCNLQQDFQRQKCQRDNDCLDMDCPKFERKQKNESPCDPCFECFACGQDCDSLSDLQGHVKNGYCQAPAIKKLRDCEGCENFYPNMCDYVSKGLETADFNLDCKQTNWNSHNQKECKYPDWVPEMPKMIPCYPLYRTKPKCGIPSTTHPTIDCRAQTPPSSPPCPQLTPTDPYEKYGCNEPCPDPCKPKCDPCPPKYDPCSKKPCWDPCPPKFDPCSKQYDSCQTKFFPPEEPCYDPCSPMYDPCPAAYIPPPRLGANKSCYNPCPPPPPNPCKKPACSDLDVPRCYPCPPRAPCKPKITVDLGAPCPTSFDPCEPCDPCDTFNPCAPCNPCDQRITVDMGSAPCPSPCDPYPPPFDPCRPCTPPRDPCYPCSPPCDPCPPPRDPCYPCTPPFDPCKPPRNPCYPCPPPRDPCYPCPPPRDPCYPCPPPRDPCDPCPPPRDPCYPCPPPPPCEPYKPPYPAPTCDPCDNIRTSCSGNITPTCGDPCTPPCDDICDPYELFGPCNSCPPPPPCEPCVPSYDPCAPPIDPCAPLCDPCLPPRNPRTPPQFLEPPCDMDPPAEPYDNASKGENKKGGCLRYLSKPTAVEEPYCTLIPEDPCKIGGNMNPLTVPRLREKLVKDQRRYQVCENRRLSEVVREIKRKETC